MSGDNSRHQTHSNTFTDNGNKVWPRAKTVRLSKKSVRKYVTNPDFLPFEIDVSWEGYLVKQI